MSFVVVIGISHTRTRSHARPKTFEQKLEFCARVRACAVATPSFPLRTTTFVGRLLLVGPTIDHHSFGVLGTFLAGRGVQYALGQLGKRSLDVDVRLGRRFHEADAVLARDRLAALLGH